MGSHRFAELHAHSYFTFLEGADAPEDYVSSAQNLDLSALALLEVDGMYSLIRALQAAKESSFPLLIGSELTLDAGQFSRYSSPREVTQGWGLPKGWEDRGIRLPVLTTSEKGYRDLCHLMSEYTLTHDAQDSPAHGLDDLAQMGDIRILTGGSRGPLRTCSS